jgi:hypothetical protein
MIEQTPIEGVSFLYTFNDAGQRPPPVQYFEIGGNRGSTMTVACRHVHKAVWEGRSRASWKRSGGNCIIHGRFQLGTTWRQRSDKLKEAGPLHDRAVKYGFAIDDRIQEAYERCVAVVRT